MAYKDDLQKYYVGFYGRPADPEGLEYWNNILNDMGEEEGIDDDDGFATRFELISEYFAGQQGETSEYDLVVEGLTHEELVDLIYENLFGRGEDVKEDDDRDFWVNELDEGHSTPITIVHDIIAGIDEGSHDEAINAWSLLSYLENVTDLDLIDIGIITEEQLQVLSSGDNAIYEEVFTNKNLRIEQVEEADYVGGVLEGDYELSLSPAFNAGGQAGGLH